MDFGKYIHELLLENEMVIIPGFGAFVSEYKPAEISEDSDEIKPPSKVVTFNQQIRNNDGLLVGYVAEKQRSSHFDALKKIEKEREDILYKLDSGERVELTDVGVLFYTEEHAIEFTAAEDDNLLLDSFGLETTTIDTIEEPEEPELINAPVVEVEQSEEPEPEVIEPVIPTVVEEPESAEEAIDERASIPVIEPESELENVPEPVFPKAEPIPEEPKKKRAWWLLLLILIPLIAVSVFIFMKGEKDGDADKQKAAKEQTKKIETPALVPTQDTVKTDTIQLIEQDTVKLEEIKAEPATEIVTDKPKYYLVGGSFSVEENAETYLNELKAKGYEAFHVGKKGRFYIIGIGTYDTFSEAEKAKQKYMTDNSGSEVWVWKK